MSTQSNKNKASLAATLASGLALAIVSVLFLAPVAMAADGPNQADAAITLNVKLALLNKLGTDSLRIHVETNAGAVTLNGTVNKRETSELAGTVARAVANVKSVDNDLKFAATENNPSETKAAAAEAEAELKDAVLETNVRIALLDKLGTDGFKISTQVASGVVTLSFDKDLSAARRSEATAVVKAVDGVTKVVNVDSKP